jgi:hypothetical protein
VLLNDSSRYRVGLIGIRHLYVVSVLSGCIVSFTCVWVKTQHHHRRLRPTEPMSIMSSSSTAAAAAASENHEEETVCDM